jgi:hypothetical protein
MYGRRIASSIVEYTARVRPDDTVSTIKIIHTWLGDWLIEQRRLKARMARRRRIIRKAQQQ